MTGRLMLFLMLLSVAHNASATDYLSFLNLGLYNTVEKGIDTYSSIVSTDFIRFGYSYETSVYVCTNGYFSIGTIPNADIFYTNSHDLISDSMVAPFAAVIDTRSTGSVRYSTFYTGDSNIDIVSSYIRSKLGVSFQATWMVVADWYFVPQPHMNPTNATNRFQGVIITDGTSSYAVFLYYCPYMRWSGYAMIGWHASSSDYRVHPLSRRSNAKDVACLNSTNSYNTVLFKLSSVSSCPTYAFGCFSGTCTNSYSSRCDGHPDCDDGSDEVACTYPLRFLSLGNNYVTVNRGENTFSSAISPSSPLQFGSSFETTVYVSTNGYFSLGYPPLTDSLSEFSSTTGYSIVAPFAADIDTTYTGSVRYNTFSAGDPNINTVSSYIVSELGMSFSGTWMLVAEWYNVPRYGSSTSKTNRFQGVIIINGTTSYAVFLYNCPYMEWSGNAIIGWQSGSSYYRSHPLSGGSNAKDVACYNALSSYNTVLFRLSSVSSCVAYSFGCFNGTCPYVDPPRCDGHPACSDGSDEVACSYNTCDSDEFLCGTGRCIAASLQCDDFGDCEDNSDEEECVNVGLAAGLSVGLTSLVLCIGIHICVVCVGFCLTRRKRKPVINTRVVGTMEPEIALVTSAQAASPTASDTEPLKQYPPEDISTEPHEVPPPYNPAFGYPTFPPPQPNTGYALPPADYSQSYHQPAQPPYGGQPYPQDPVYFPPAQYPEHLLPPMETTFVNDQEPLLQQ